MPDGVSTFIIGWYTTSRPASHPSDGYGHVFGNLCLWYKAAALVEKFKLAIYVVTFIQPLDIS